MGWLIVLDQGTSSSAGTRAELLTKQGEGGGHCAELWRHQSGGYLSEDLPDEALIEDDPVDDMPYFPQVAERICA